MHIFVSTIFVIISIITSAVDLQTPNGGLKKTVWIHYTGWHNPLDNGFAIGKYYNYPIFSSTRSQIADYRKEFKLAKQQGIDGFLIDLVSRDGKKTNYVQHMKKLLKAAEGMDFWIGPCLDQTPSPEWQSVELTRILKECGNHPNFPKIGKKYLVVTYSWYEQGPENWRKIRKALADKGYPLYLVANMKRAFDKIEPELYDKFSGTYEMVYSFGYLGLAGENIDIVYDRMIKCAAKNDATWMCTVVPGYIGAWMNGRNDYYQPHLGFDRVLQHFDIIHSQKPQWIHLTSWNDHDETPFMPMAFEFGGNSRINRYLLDRWRKHTLPAKSQVLFAYHREEIVGTVLRIESLFLPGKRSRTVTISGQLIAPDGKTMYKLAKQTLNKSAAKAYVRNEWNIPTAKLAAVPALTPIITIMENGKSRTAKLPPVMLKTGWLQNQTTMKVPFALMTSGKATLTTSQKGNLLTANVKFNCGEKVVRAELFRNDRPIGPLTLKATENPLLFAQFCYLNRNRFAIRLYKGHIVAAARFSTDNQSPYFAWTNDAVVSLNNARWHQVKMQITMNQDGRFINKVNRSNAQEVTLKQLLNSHILRLGGKKPELALVMDNFDNNLNDRPAMQGMNSGKLFLKLWSRKKLTNDMFYVQFKTESGKIFFSPIITPFIEQKPVKMRVVQTMVNLETSSGATGQPGYKHTGFMTTPPFTKPEVIETIIHPANLRAGRWTFDLEAWDFLGERPLQSVQKTFWKDCGNYIIKNGHDGGRCLNLNGKSTVKLRCRIWPMGPCTIDFFLKPEGKITAKQSIIKRLGWTSAFNFYLLQNGKLEVIRNGLINHTESVSMISSKPLTSGKWTRIRLVYDGKNAELFCNGKLVAKKAMPFHMVYGNCTVAIGGKGGFTGQFDDLTILSYPAKPRSGKFPPLPTSQKLDTLRKFDKAKEYVIFKYSPKKGDLKQMKTAKLMSVFSAASIISLTATAAPIKVELGKLIKRVNQPNANEACTFVKGNPSIRKPNAESTKAIVTVGENGTFSINTGPKSRKTSDLIFPLKIKDGQELVVKIKNVITSAKPKGWVATFIGVEGSNKLNICASLTTDMISIAQYKPKWKPLGGNIKVKYPTTLQIRRMDGTLSFIVNGSPRVSIKENKGAVDIPYIYITSQKQTSWSILNIASFELREVNKTAIAKEKKAVKNY